MFYRWHRPGRPLQAKNNKANPGTSVKQLPEKGPQLPRGSTSPGNPAQNQPGSPPQLAQDLSQESQRHIFRLSLSLEFLVFRLKSQEEPVHNNKDGFSLCMPPRARCCTLGLSFPICKSGMMMEFNPQHAGD